MKRMLIRGCVVKAIMAVTLSAVSLSGEAQDYKNWVQQAPKLEAAYFKTEEAKVVAERVMSCQLETGGWPKNINFFRNGSTDSLKLDENDGTIDNDATTTEVRFLMRLYESTGDLKYHDSAIKGIEYLLRMQYANGGWPQYWPRKDHYHAHITFNDNAQVNVMRLLRQVYNGEAPYASVPDTVKAKAKVAFDKGVECILNSQVKQGDKLTVWCQQHDEQTLEPVGARAFELPGLCSSESVGITLLLMSIENPSESVQLAINGAVNWFKENKIDGIRKEEFTDSLGRRDYRMVPDSLAPAIWARFYTLDGNKPFFCGRDGVMRYNVEEIDYERRNGYAWYGRQAERIFRKLDEQARQK